MYWELTMSCHFKVIADGHTDTQTTSLNTIVLQPLRGSTNKNKATRSPEISREQVQKLTPQFLLYIYIGYRFPLSLIYYLGKPPSS